MSTDLVQKKCTLTKVYCNVVSTTVNVLAAFANWRQTGKTCVQEKDYHNNHILNGSTFIRFGLRCMFFKSGSLDAYNDPTTKFIFF